jgi:CRISPR-associated endonuclease Cas2
VLILVSYDIPDDRRRTKLAHTLKDFGQRVQYSVFECLLTADQVAHLELTRLSGHPILMEKGVRDAETPSPLPP